MDIFSNLAIGFGVAVTAQNLLYCFTGVFLGTLIGVLPGIAPVATVAMLLPLTFSLSPAASLIMLAGIYYGAQYGGSTTAILVNIPGESSAVVTTIDGHAMAKQGRAGPALGIAAISSFIAGCIATLVVALFSPPLAEIALKFQPADYFSLMVFGLVGAVVLARGSVRKAIAMVVLGLLLGLVGTDVNSGVIRFAFGLPALAEGISFAALAMGMFGVAEVIYNLEQHAADRKVVAVAKIGRVMPTLADLRQCLPSIARGTGLGALLGILPGGGALLSSFAAYTVEKKVASAPKNFGNGDIRGVAAPEAANNAGAQTSFIPMLTLGVPSNPTMALMIGALMIQGIQPGPQAMLQRPDLFWGIVASMWIGNLFLLLLNLPLVGLWVRLLAVPYRLLFPAILMFCCIGVYSINNNPFDLFQLVVFSALGYMLLKLGCEPAPLVLGLVLGPMMEEYLRRALLISLGDPTVLITSPLSAAFLIAALVLLVSIAVPAIRTQREVAMKE
ncbi:MAG: tripartite tricarboxylate transporter permease [Rhizobiales bacterium]|nr:tripartite tricarboxylate transporter permease [Hyphomicrobiales bacterium]